MFLTKREREREREREPPNIDIYPFTPGSIQVAKRENLSRPLQLPPPPQVHATFLNPKRRSSFLNEYAKKKEKNFSNPIHQFWAIPKFLYILK